MQENSRTLQAAEKLTIVPLTPERCAEWDQFCLQSPDAWFWHTSRWLEYTLHYRPELQPRSYSFFCLHAGSVAAVCPLILETYNREADPIREFSYGGDAGPAPGLANTLSERTKKKVLKRAFAYCDELARELNVARASFRMSPLATSFYDATISGLNPLLKFGFSDISLTTQIIDLVADEKQLLQAMRKGHRADIIRSEKLLQAKVLDKDSITSEAFERYRMLHHKAAGRVTRPLVTFQMMYNWIRDGLAILSVASLHGKDVGFALASVYKDGAYYSSSCEDPEHNDLPIGHILQWRALQWLKTHSVRRYEIGLQFYSSQPHAIISQKESNISFFKRGFGGAPVPSWRGEKFYDKQYCLAILKERAEKYAATVNVPQARIGVPPG
jgi:Acetyltransferase (GNAT) domain